MEGRILNYEKNDSVKKISVGKKVKSHSFVLQMKFAQLLSCEH